MLDSKTPSPQCSSRIDRLNEEYAFQESRTSCDLAGTGLLCPV